MSCIEKINPNEPIHLFIIRGVNVGKTFTLKLLIQALVHFYNRHLHSDPFIKEIFAHSIYGKSIDGTTIHSSLSIPLNCKDLPSLNSK